MLAFAEGFDCSRPLGNHPGAVFLGTIPETVDKASVEAFERSKKERFDEVYRRLAPAIHARCRRLVGVAGADDACQESFVKLYKNLDRLPTDRDVLRWLYRVSANVCISQLRKRRTAGAPTFEPRDTGPSPEELFRDQQLVEILCHKLPARLVEPALLHYCDGIDQTRVGEMLGLSRRTVIKRLNDFRERAQQLLGGRDVH